MPRIHYVARLVILVLASLGLILFGVRLLISQDINPKPELFPLKYGKMDTSIGKGSTTELRFIDRVDGFLLAGVLLAMLLLTVLMVKKLSPNFKTAVLSFLSGTGFTSGLKVFLLAIAPLEAIADYDQASILVGGLAVMWLSVENAVELLKA